MVYEPSMLAGRSRSSKPQEFLSLPSVFRGALLTTRPGPPKRTPFASGSQLTLFGGKGFNGQSAPMRRAMIAMPQRIPRRFFSRCAPNVSFTDRAWRNSRARRRSAQPLTRPSARKVTQRRPFSLPDDNHPSRYTWISVLISKLSGKIYPTASAREPPHIVLLRNRPTTLVWSIRNPTCPQWRKSSWAQRAILIPSGHPKPANDKAQDICLDEGDYRLARHEQCLEFC